MTRFAYNQLIPPTQDAKSMRLISQKLAKHDAVNGALSLHLSESGQQAESIELPNKVVEPLLEILKIMASGQGVTILPANTELTTVEASEILNVSRPYLIKLLEEKAIPYRKVGKHRRILMEDVMEYKKSITATQEVLNQLTEEAQENGLGYNLCP